MYQTGKVSLPSHSFWSHWSKIAEVARRHEIIRTSYLHRNLLRGTMARLQNHVDRNTENNTFVHKCHFILRDLKGFPWSLTRPSVSEAKFIKRETDYRTVTTFMCSQVLAWIFLYCGLVLELYVVWYLINVFILCLRVSKLGFIASGRCGWQILSILDYYGCPA